MDIQELSEKVRQQSAFCMKNGYSGTFGKGAPAERFLHELAA